MSAQAPDKFEPNGDFPVVEQAHVAGGMHAVSAIAHWADEIPPQTRQPGMSIMDRSTRKQWILNDTLDGVDPSSADAAIELVSSQSKFAAGFGAVDNGDGTTTITYPDDSPLVATTTVLWRGYALPVVTLDI